MLSLGLPSKNRLRSPWIWPVLRGEGHTDPEAALDYLGERCKWAVVHLGICYAITWIPICGILFPFPFFLLIIIRERVVPRLVHPEYLQELDATEYEELTGSINRNRNIPGRSPSADGSLEVQTDDDSEILDELTTSRGELKLRSASRSGHQHQQI